MKSMKSLRFWIKLIVSAIGLIGFPLLLFAQASPFPETTGEVFTPEQLSTTLSILLPLASISLLPIFVVTCTSFLRVVIILGFIRTAIGTNQTPPNMVLTSLALLLSIFIMTPTIQRINTEALVPYKAGEVTQMRMLELGAVPLKEFMLKHTREKDLALFLEFSHVEPPEQFLDIPFFVLAPSFVLSELKTAFQIGFLLYMPFVVIDLVISNILLSLGMFMLSPAMISMPFKILLVVLTDMWNLLIQGILISYQ